MRMVILLALVGIAAGADFAPQTPNTISFPPHEARLVRLVILGSPTQPCIDELEVYAADGKQNLALAPRGARAAASSCLPGYRFHKIEHLNDGRYGNSRSWIAAGVKDEWAEIQLPTPARVAKVVFSRDREGQYRDRVPWWIEVRVSTDGQTWQRVAEIKHPAPAAQRITYVPPVPLPDPITWDGVMPCFASGKRGARCSLATICRRSTSSVLRCPAARPTGAASLGSTRYRVLWCSSPK
jgi:hypothetical protein